MEYTISKLAKLSGTSKRTLHYYDEIGLLKPMKLSESGYRIYGQEQVDLLQQILLYKELGFSLEKIQELIISPEFDRKEAFFNHLESLNKRQEHLKLLITNVTKSLAAIDKTKQISDQDKFIGFSELRLIEDDSKRAIKLYELIDENNRLNRTRAARIEFITHTMMIDRYLKPGGKIVDIGAGPGEYSLHYANLGYDVTAVDLSLAHLEELKKKMNPSHQIQLIQGDGRDLYMLEADSFHLVLVFGPLYHLRSEKDRSRCIQEAKRICEKDGVMLFAFINHDMIPFTETFCYNPTHFLDSSEYNATTHRVEDFPFVFLNAEEARQMITQEDIEIIATIASEGIGELMAEEINAMPKEVYERYLDYHLHICEKPEMLGMTNHFLMVGKNPVKQ